VTGTIVPSGRHCGIEITAYSSHFGLVAMSLEQGPGNQSKSLNGNWSLFRDSAEAEGILFNTEGTVLPGVPCGISS